MTIPPWLNVTPSQFVQAGQAGAEAGLGAARVAQEAAALKQRAAQEAARLSHAEHLQSMELQARQEIAEQNRLREDQQMALQNAYRTSQIGLGKARIAQAEAIADQKAREAALQFADEQGFTQEIAGGSPVAQAMAKYPRVRPSIVNQLRLSVPGDVGNATIVTHPEFGERKFLRQPTGHETPLSEGGLSEGTAERIIQRLKEQRRQYEAKDPEYQEIDADIKRLEKGGKATSSTQKRFRYDPKTGTLNPVTEE